jgi:hypothetical protein
LNSCGHVLLRGPRWPLSCLSVSWGCCGWGYGCMVDILSEVSRAKDHNALDAAGQA